jgi:TolB-like protein
MKNREILDSWKDISDYLDRDIRTCARWEKELGLPIYRFDKDSPRSKVFAYKSEIDEWLKEKKIHKEIRKKPFLEKKGGIIGLVSAVALIMAVSASLYIDNGKFSPADPENLSIAVLPSESLNFSAHEQYISEGICNEITQSLSSIKGLRVISGASFARSENPEKDLENIREKFKVNHFLKTKIEKNRDKLKICAQLVRIEDDKVAWHLESQDRSENIFSLKEDICLKIHQRLNPNNEITSALFPNNAKAPNKGAFDNYLKGNHILNRATSDNDDPWKLYIQGKYYQEKWTKESNDWAISFFSKAIELDEHFAKAYVRLARCYLNYLNFNWDLDEKWLNKAEELLKKASLIDPECSEYYSTLIIVYLIKYLYFDENTKEKAFESAQQAVKKYPGCPLLRSQLGFCHYLRFGEYGNESDFNKALEHNEESYYLRPYHVNNIRYAELLMLNREYERALTVCSGIQEGESSLISNFRIGEIYYYMGDLDSSEDVFLQFENGNDFNFSIGSLFYLGMIAAQREDTCEVKRIINKISVIAPKEFYFLEDKLKLASIYMGIGEKELGYDYLQALFSKDKTYKTRYISLKYIEIDKNFDNYRYEERFKNTIQ